MKRFALILIGLALGVGLLRGILPAFITESGGYSIVEPHLTCAQATQLSKRVVERLGYALDDSEASGEKETLISATRRGSGGSEKLAVKIFCGNDGVRVEATPDISPCEQANQRAKQAMEQLQFTITSFSPATTGKRGVIKGTRERPEGQETTMATIHCNARRCTLMPVRRVRSLPIRSFSNLLVIFVADSLPCSSQWRRR